jgi:hypothetical protein
MLILMTLFDVSQQVELKNSQSSLNYASIDGKLFLSSFLCLVGAKAIEGDVPLRK